MRQLQKTAYELSESQVTTPARVVSLFWELTQKRRNRLGTVLDMGAGDGRFNAGGEFDSYVGLEIDSSRVMTARVPRNGVIINECAFNHPGGNYDACIGNPPYVRHHDLESPWKENTVARLEHELGIALNKHGNLYLYFLCLGLLKTHNSGLISMVIPYEWVSRPSAKSIRDYIHSNKWSVEVYRFKDPIFDGVLTTASISIIDKQTKTGTWAYYDVTSDFKILEKRGVVDSAKGVLKYSKRNQVWAMRGLSPGTQKIFTLTEGERIHHGLTHSDVTPCVTTFRNLPPNVKFLNRRTFKKHFIDAGQRCWLIKSYEKKLSSNLTGYLDNVSPTDRDTYTCNNQSPWYNFLPHPTPQLLVSSGFIAFGPKVVTNNIGACAVGSVFGIHGAKKNQICPLRNFLAKVNFERRLVAHARTLKKIEVKQFNTIIGDFFKTK